MITNPILHGAYDPRLVSLSFVIAICASYAALRLGTRTTFSKGGTRLAWLTGGAVAMGFGIWSMHYVGMLAFSLPIPILYHLPTVIVSLLAAIFASGVALFIVSRESITARRAALGSILMGGGIVAMHYLGMAAMRLPAMCHYDPALVALSGLIAVTCSLAALWLTFRLRATSGLNIWKLLSAVAMGIGIAAMHYTGMAAAKLYTSAAPVDYTNAVNVSALGTTGIVTVAFLLLAFAIFTSVIDQRLAAHRAMTEELFRSRQMLQSILDNIPQRVFWKDRDGRYLGCNRAFAQDVGLTLPDEIAGKRDPDLPWSELGIRYSSHLQATTERPVSNSEFEATNAQGESCWLRASSVPLFNSTGDAFGVLGAYDDITDQKIAADAIKRSNAALSEFAYTVSHDLQSPLRVARNYAQLLTRRYGAQIHPDGHSLVGFIEENLGHMEELIDSLLKYATATEAEPGGLTLISLEVALERALSNLQLLIRETNAQITFTQLPNVTVHPIQMIQIFQNLISNAIKYRKPGTIPAVHVSAKELAKDWVLSIKDNGIGIAAEDRARIFAPLKRLHGREIPGFGIGLATCRKVIEQLGGRIWVESNASGGSTFCFTVPKTQSANLQTDASYTATNNK
jgi:two-component system, sensor histidine kinase and response regulator